MELYFICKMFWQTGIWIPFVILTIVLNAERFKRIFDEKFKGD